VECNHQWCKRDKKTIQILTRFCTNCGRVEDMNDTMTSEQISNIMGD
jgi:hypothetical protein